MSAERDYGIIFQIGDILVSEEVITGFFCCDYPVCKGECCIAGEFGAPLDEDELQVLEDEYPNFGKYMTPAGHAAIAEKGFFELDIEGELVTTVAHGGECAYSFQDYRRRAGAEFPSVGRVQGRFREGQKRRDSRV